MKMNCIVGRRGNGKTAELIKLSAKTGYTILAVNRMSARNIAMQACKMNAEIPKPMSLMDVQDRHETRLLKGVLVDEAGTVLSNLIGTHVVCATFNGEAYNPSLKGLGLIQKLRAFKAMADAPRIAGKDESGDGVGKR